MACGAKQRAARRAPCGAARGALAPRGELGRRGALASLRRAAPRHRKRAKRRHAFSDGTGCASMRP
jgi:hypothetical protein